MITQARILSLEGSYARLELVRVSPWGYRIGEQVHALLPPALELRRDEVVEVETKSRSSDENSEYHILRRSAQAWLALPAAVAVLVIVILGTQFPVLRAGIAGSLVLPLGWLGVFGGKAFMLHRYRATVRADE